MDVGKDGGDIGQEAVVVLLERPVDEGGAPDDILFWHESPDPGIRAVGAIISEHEIVIGRDYQVVDRSIFEGGTIISGVDVCLF